MNTMHLLEQIQKLWPDKLNDEQGKAVADATARLELTTEQVTAVCRSVWSESASKTPLQVRLIDRLKDAANPLRNARVVGQRAETVPAAQALAYYHRDLCERDLKMYGYVRRFSIVDAHDEMARLFGPRIGRAWVEKFAPNAAEWLEYFDNRAAKSRGAKQRAMEIQR